MTTAIFEKSKSDKEAWDREKLALQTYVDRPPHMTMTMAEITRAGR